MRYLFSLSLFLWLLSGCAKAPEEFNKSAEYWYEKLTTSVAHGSLEKADGYYTSLLSEHPNSPFLAESTLILAQAHMAYDEYLLSEHFLDQYIQHYATSSDEVEYAQYLKIKAKFLALPNPGREQSLIQETLENISKFKSAYPTSIYVPLVDTMQTQLQLSIYVLNDHIAQLYDRLQRPKAAAYYRSLTPLNWMDPRDVRGMSPAWYRVAFEGDGGDSWYAFMIPTTRSIVADAAHESN